MRQVKAQTSTGDVLFDYVISTPQSEDAEKIDPALPTILFLHPMYVGKIVFHNQFADTDLRRFNLVTLDDRSHGSNPGPVSSGFGIADMAEDVSRFMNALQLPPCHIVGISIGSCVALEMAISHPNQVLSLFMISPLSLTEPEDVAAGRQEIFECWVAGLKEDDPDETGVLDAVFGAVQLAFNDPRAKIVEALVRDTVPRGQKNWSREHFDVFRTISVDVFVDRQPHPVDVLRRAAGCPVQLVSGLRDIAYPLHCAEELRDHLASADIDVKLSTVDDAPHYGCVTHFKPINRLLHDWVMEKTEAPIPPVKHSVKSPFNHALAAVGYKNNGNDSSDEDDLSGS